MSEKSELSIFVVMALAFLFIWGVAVASSISMSLGQERVAGQQEMYATTKPCVIGTIQP